MRFAYAASVLLLLLAFAPGCATAPATSSSAPRLQATRVYTSTLTSPEQFQAYSRTIAGERFTKFIVDLRSDRIYYFDVNVYKLHVDFVFNEMFREPLNPRRLLKFNRNYDADKPEFLLCYLVHHEGPDLWTFSFWEGDRATPQHVARAMRKIEETFYGAKRVLFRPDSTMQETVARRLQSVKWISNDKIYKASNYQAFNTGQSVGVLRLVPASATNQPLHFNPHDIVVLAEALPDITPVRGIITETFSTPLSHLALRARAWNVPHVGLKGALKKVESLDGKTVFFEAKAGSHLLRLATETEVSEQRAKDNKRRHVVLPPADLSTKAIAPLAKIAAHQADAYGSKTANLGAIRAAKMEGFHVPDGVGVPIHFYEAHLRRHGIWEAIQTTLASPVFKADAAVRAKELAQIRRAIRAAPLEPAFEAALHASLTPLMTSDIGAVALFVRSSTNAEDLPGFSGAGLYDTVPNVKTPEDLSRAIRQVWASVWNARAFEEREHFHIDHLKVYGAALVQRGVNATAAGVLVTENIFDPRDTDSYTINAKSGLGMRVVEGRRVPEQLLYDTSNMGIKVLSRSDETTMLVFDDRGGVKEVPNPNKGRPILSDTRVLQLAMAATKVKGLFGWKQAVDIEWLFQGHELFIVQARPFVGSK